MENYLKKKGIKKKKSVSKSLVFKKLYTNLSSENNIPDISVEQIGELLIPSQILPEDYLKYELAEFPVNFRNMLEKSKKQIIFHYKHVVPVFKDQINPNLPMSENIIEYKDTGEIVKVDIFSFFTKLIDGTSEHRIYQLGHRYSGKDDNF